MNILKASGVMLLCAVSLFCAKKIKAAQVDFIYADMTGPCAGAQNLKLNLNSPGKLFACIGGNWSQINGAASAGVVSFNTRAGVVSLTSSDITTALSNPALIAGSNITITGTWPNQTINSTAGGSAITLQTNGSNNGSQSALNLIAGANMTITNSGGNVTFTSSGTGGSAPSGTGFVHVTSGVYDVPGVLTDSDIPATLTSKTIDGISPTIFGFLTGISSNVQTQISGKQATITGAPGSWPSTFPPNVPGTSTLGGVKTKDCTGIGHVLGLDNTGTFTCSADATTGGGTIDFRSSGTSLGSISALNIIPGSGVICTPTFSSGVGGVQCSIDPTVVFPVRNLASYVFGDGVTPLSGTLDGCMNIPSASTITGVTLTADVSGSATVDVRTVAYSSYTGPASATSITASAVPALSSAIKYQDNTITGWTTAVSANTMVCFHLTSPSTATLITAQLKGQ